MVSSPDSIKAKINKKLFRSLRSYNREITINRYTTTTGRYGEERTLSSSDTILAVTLNYERAQRNFDQFGKYENSSYILLYEADDLLSESDDIIIDGVTYRVLGIESPILGDTVLINRAFIAEKKD